MLCRRRSFSGFGGMGGAGTLAGVVRMGRVRSSERRSIGGAAGLDCFCGGT